MNSQPKHIYEFGPFRLDVVERLLWRGTEPVSLTLKAFELLLILIEHHGHVLEKQKLMQAVWPDTFVEETNLTRNIFTLRQILGKSSGGEKYIETIPKRGYRFIAEVKEWRDEDAESGLPLRAQSCQMFKRRVAAGAAIKSIAVMPFNLLRAKESDDYLGLSITDALITKLTSLRQIIVRPTSAVLKYMGSERDPLTAGREQKVDVVLDGHVQKSGDQIRLTVQLFNVEDSFPLWGERFDETFTNLFALQDSVSEQVAQALLLKLTAKEKQQLTNRPTDNAKAYQLYIKGRYYLNQSTPEGYKKAIEHFQKAVDEDINYALAYAGLADGYSALSRYGVLPSKETLLWAKAAVEEALRLDDTLAEAHTSMAYVAAAYGLDLANAEKEFKRAIELNPNYPPAHEWYGMYLAVSGRFDQAIAEIEQAQELDPLSLTISVHAGFIYYWARQYDQAIIHAQKALELDPSFILAHICLAAVYGQKAMFPEAIAVLQHQRTLVNHPLILPMLARTYALAGQRDEAIAILGELEEWSKQGPTPLVFLALAYAALDDKSRAFELLEKAYINRDVFIDMVNVEPGIDNLRSDPRFTDLLQRVKWISRA